MKSKKIISLLAAAALSASAFASLTAQAAIPVGGTVDLKTEDSKPEVVATLTEVDGEGYAIMKFKLINNETLSYTADRTGVTSNGINTIQVKFTLDENVFDVSTTYVQGLMTGVSVNGEGQADVAFAFPPTTPDTYMINVPEYLFEVDAKLKDGYTIDNVPSSAITWGESIVEYTAYKGVKVTEGATNYTIYAYNAPTKDYDLTLRCDETFKDEVIPTTYKVNVDPAVANGTVTVDPAEAEEGATVAVTATPAQGYKCTAITVDGEKIDGTTFAMPAKDVTVSATFVKESHEVASTPVGDAKVDEAAGIKYTPFTLTTSEVWTKIMMMINDVDTDVTAAYKAPTGIAGDAIVGIIVKSTTDQTIGAPRFVVE